MYMYIHTPLLFILHTTSTEGSLLSADNHHISLRIHLIKGLVSTEFWENKSSFHDPCVCETNPRKAKLCTTTTTTTSN